MINFIGILVFFWPFLLITALFAVCATGGALLLIRPKPARATSLVLQKIAAFLIAALGCAGLWLLWVFVYRDLIHR